MRYHVQWHTKEKDGYTPAEKCEMAGVALPDEPEIEEGSEHILKWFYQLNARRQPGFSGPSPLTFSEIRAWQELTQTLIRPDEVEAVMAMDSAYLDEVFKKREAEKE